MSTSASLFCEYCGAANESEAHYCCFCGRPLDEEEATTANTSSAISSSLTTLPIDTLLKGRYRIVKPVGQGGMGTVYRAQDTSLNNRAVALKELVVNDPGSQTSSEAIEAFKREATLLAGLQHTNLPSVFEHFQENGRWYMAMTFIQGETLADHLERTRNKKLPLREVLEIGQQLSSVLYYLHNQYPPIIFRDVKPANIMRTPDGRIYLIDFGVARRFKSGQKKDTIPFGSLGYAAPEQFGKAQTTQRSDIYALGATMHELLTGHDPASSPLKFPSLRSLEPSLPFKLVTLITQMLDQDESKRPANMLIVEQKLQEIESTPWQTTTFPSFPSSTSAPTSNNKPSWRLVGVLSTLLALFCLVIGGAVGDVIGTSAGAANTTATYQANATGTVSAQANATATAMQVAALPDPYFPKGMLTLFDPLSQEDQWQANTDSDWGGSCLFKNGALQTSQTKTNRMFECDENAATEFKNMAIQVEITIAQGDCGGITLLENSDGSKFYKYEVCSDGSYGFYEYVSDKGTDALTLANSTSSDFHTGSSKNTLAVVANSGSFDLYINGQKQTNVVDSTYDTGTIGLCVDSNTEPTTVLFQNIAVWTLP